MDSGVPYTFLRNSWYIENYTSQLPQYLWLGAIVNATGGAKIAAAARADYAEAAAAVLTAENDDNTVYELGGTAFTMAELADTITAVTGTSVTEQQVTTAQLIDILRQSGLDDATATFVAALDDGAADGGLDTDSGDLARLINRPSTPLADVIAASV